MTAPDTPLLSLAYITVENADPVEQVEAAAKAGFNAVGLRALQPTGRPLAHELIGQQARLSAVAARCRDLDVVVLDLEVLTLTPSFRLEDCASFLDVAASLEARFVQVVCEDSDLNRVADNLALVAQAARAAGTIAALEFMAFRSVNNLQTAARLVDQAVAGDPVILLDALHLCRSGGDAAALSDIPPGHVGYMQICDAPAAMPADLIQEARFDRLYPGEGQLPLAAIMAALPSGVAMSVEVPRSTMRDRGSVAQAAEAAKWTKAFIAKNGVPYRLG